MYKRQIKRRLGELRKVGMIVRMGSNKSGYWEVVSLKDRKEGDVYKRQVLSCSDNEALPKGEV